MSKEHIYQNNIRRSLGEVWTQLERLMMTLPPETHLDWDTLSKEHKRTINNIKSVEAEWIIDPSIRRELSMLSEDGHE